MESTTYEPWYRRCYRWGQTNLTELDPVRYDHAWWREYWKRTRIQGVIVNAGGIVQYYPSKYPEVHRAVHLGDRDLFGEITAAAHEDGLAVLARMDSNRVHEAFYLEHPDWCAVDAQGNPYRAGDLFVTCINSPYYHEFLPSILREIIVRSGPEGFTDNSYSGLSRNEICYCHYCSKSFRDSTGMNIPEKKDWDSPAFRRWIVWSYERRLAIWDVNNQTTTAAGGKDCLWVGMISGDAIGQSMSLRDMKAICERTEIVMLDFQMRRSRLGFQRNGEAGKLIHEMLGWNKLIPESMAMYQAGEPTFRVASKPEPEARLWAVQGFAGTIQPWWHHIGAYHEDRRQYRTTVPLFEWHERNEKYLLRRQPIASVGIAWSQANIDFYGRDQAEVRVGLPWQGFTQALIRARIPYLPIHVDNIERDLDRFSVLILPNVGALSDAHCEAIRRFVARGGSVIASGETSLYNEWGDSRSDFALADLFGVSTRKVAHGADSRSQKSWDSWTAHSYLRLVPELRKAVDGPHVHDEPPVVGERHPILEGFDETDILPFGGRLEIVDAHEGNQTLMTYVPSFPIYPPETAWMRNPSSTLPGLILNESRAGRVAYLPADIDRCYGRDNLPDHGRLLANLVRWAAHEQLPLYVEGNGLIDCHLYRQPGRVILHLVNLTNAETWRASVHELTPVGPFRIQLRLPEGIHGSQVQLCVAEQTCDAEIAHGWASFEVPRVVDHEMVVVE